MITGTVTGRLGADPETKQVRDTTVTELRIASNNPGGRDRGTTWVKVSVWGKHGEVIAQYKRKGDFIAVSGSLVLEEWQGNDGTRYTLTMRGNDSDFGPNTRQQSTADNPHDGSRDRSSYGQRHNEQKRDGYQDQGQRSQSGGGGSYGGGRSGGYGGSGQGGGGNQDDIPFAP